MQKETKFDAGDVVWYITGNLYRKKTGFDWVVEGKEKIIIAMVSQREKEPIEVMYSLEKHAWIYEKDCFATKAEAQKECERRNNERRCIK